MKISAKKAVQAHNSYMELEKIIEDMGDAMRRAHMPYMAASRGKMTPGQEMVWNRYICFAMTQEGLTWGPCSKCGQSTLEQL